LSLSYDLYTLVNEEPASAAEQQLRFDELDVERQIEQLRLMLPMITTLCKQQMRVYGLTGCCQECPSCLRDAQALEQAGVGTL